MHFSSAIKFFKTFSLPALLTGSCMFSCSTSEEKRFQLLPSTHTGISFSNTIEENDSFNILNFHYIYNGGGVGVGDFDQDGRPDLVFSGNQSSSKIYLNQGQLKFQDITTAAGFNVEGWSTGVSIIDINSDGWPDIYVSTGGLNCNGQCKNSLWINQGKGEDGLPHFVERAAEYGLEDGNYTQQALFFDYDLDGDLDVYLLHNVIDQRDKNAPSEKRFINEQSKDVLLRNDQGKYIDVSNATGITERGYGLGMTINDFNKDGWPDLYIANDFLSDDLMYLNKGRENGVHLGFEEVSKQLLKHTSYNSMGVDVADINNDAQSDILVLDMMPEYHERQKTMIGFMNYNKFLFGLRQGYTPQFIRNTLQLHNGFLNDEVLPFSEVGYLSGIYNTDWSWSPLLADFDNDGDRDLYVTNGYGKDITDLDFINYSNQAFTFGTPEARQKKLFQVVQQMEPIHLPNYFFENEGDLKFENRSTDWEVSRNSISNGAVYADLDDDGDLDIVVNNINAEAYVIENQTNELSPKNYLKIKLQGSPQNASGIGSQLYLETNGQKQYHYQSPVRAYLSCMDQEIHFGLGNASEVEHLRIEWPDGRIQLLEKIAANQTLELKIADAAQQKIKEEVKPPTRLFETSTLAIQQQENLFQDFDAQPLLLHQHSRQGPCLAAANIDAAPGDEFFIGGAKGYPSRIFTKQKDGSWHHQSLPDSLHEDTGAAFFDFDGDGDLDLYVVSGGTEFLQGADEYQDRLYLNDGFGHFEKVVGKMPEIRSSGSCVLPADFDQDGDIDLFVGGRVVPGAYPRIPQSYLLINEGGELQDRTTLLSPELKHIGMVADALWSDIDQDGWQDLLIVGEWMPIRLLKNSQGHLQLTDAFKETNGLWNSLAVADFDQDGDQDLIVGNLGLNSRLKASVVEPLVLYKEDFDRNGSPDPLIGQYDLNKEGERKLYPLHARDDVVKQLVKVKRRYIKYADFGQATFPELLQTTEGADDQLQLTELRSMIFENQGEGTFKAQPLPQAAQLAPIQDILIGDFDQDGWQDVLLTANDYTAEKNGGWYDASNGLLLKGMANLQFEAIPTSQSGFLAPRDNRQMVLLNDQNGHPQILVGQNDGPLLQLRAAQASQLSLHAAHYDQ